MSEKPTSNSPLNLIGTLVGAVGGWTFSQYCGVSIWIPGAACVLLLLLFAKTEFKPRHFAGAIATTGGHVVWFLVGMLIAHAWFAVGLDIVVLTVGIVWLWLRPGLGSVLYLGVVQLLSLWLNAVSLSSMSFGSREHRALTAHLVFHLIALICLAVGYWHMRKNAPDQAPEPGPSAATPPAASPPQ